MTSADTHPSLSPSPPTLAPRDYSWKAWVLFWIVVIALQAALLSNNASLDTLLWRTTRWAMGDQDDYSWAQYKAQHAAEAAQGNAPFYTHVNPPWTRAIKQPNGEVVLQGRLYKRTETIWRVMRDLGEPVMTFLIILFVWVYDHRRLKAALLVLATTVPVGLVGWLLRASAGRWRPIVDDGNNAWSLWRGFSETSNLSWPSGHATLAFTTAAVLSYLSPKGRNLFVGIACFCALSRVVLQAHFYSDVILGSAIGWCGGYFLVRYFDRTLKVPPIPFGKPA